MKVKLSSLPDFTCFVGKDGREKKKVEDGRVASLKGKAGHRKVSYRKLKSDPEVEPKPCSVEFLGLGHRRHPDVLVQIGDGNILSPRRKR